MLRNKMLTAAILTSLAFAAGCKKSGKGAMGGAAGAMSDVLPKETGFMVGISINKLRSTKLWETVSKKATEDPEAKATMDEIKAECGMDLILKACDQLAIGSDERSIDLDLRDDSLLSLEWGKGESKCFDTLQSKLRNSYSVRERTNLLLNGFAIPHDRKESFIDDV